MATLLCDVIVFHHRKLGHMRQQSMPLALLTMERVAWFFYCYVCVWFCSYSYGALVGGPFTCQSSANIDIIMTFR